MTGAEMGHTPTPPIKPEGREPTAVEIAGHVIDRMHGDGTKDVPETNLAGIDSLDMPDFSISPTQVRRARAVLQPRGEE